MFPPFTSTAVTGPGSSSEVPNAVHVAFEKQNRATFDTEESDNAIEPEAMSVSWFAYLKW